MKENQLKRDSILIKAYLEEYLKEYVRKGTVIVMV